MKLELDPPADDATVRAVREAIARAGLGIRPADAPHAGAWRQAALAGEDEGAEWGVGYAWPRISRGATRA